VRIVEIKHVAASSIMLRWEGDGPKFQVEKAAAVIGRSSRSAQRSLERVFIDPDVLKTSDQVFYRIRQI
jgi:hypothetical protein